MFDRIAHGDSAELITIVAFSFAASIFITISWRAMKMGRAQIERFANLPFSTATPEASHEPDTAHPTR